VPDEILNLFESTHITINFRDNKMRVSFQELDELIHYFYHQFEVLILKQELYFFITTKKFLAAVSWKYFTMELKSSLKLV
jgi:hypothetical protein